MCLASSGSDMVLSDSPSLKLWVPKMRVVSERGQAGGYLENAVHTVNDDGTITRYEELQINHEHVRRLGWKMEYAYQGNNSKIIIEP